MIDLYYWPTPNGHKITILLEELGWDYNVIPIDIAAGDQFNEDFLKISPNNKMPAIIDHNGPGGEPISMFESGAIMIYLAEKAGKFIGKDRRDYLTILQWLMFQMGGLGPMLGQNHHFRSYAPEEIQYAIDRYTTEAQRLYGVMDKRLADNAYLAGDDYSIADMACFPWNRLWERQGMQLDDYPNLKRWFNEIYERPAVVKGLAVLKEEREAISKMSAEEKAKLFGSTAYVKGK